MYINTCRHVYIQMYIAECLYLLDVCVYFVFVLIYFSLYSQLKFQNHISHRLSVGDACVCVCVFMCVCMGVCVCVCGWVGGRMRFSHLHNTRILNATHCNILHHAGTL